MSPRNDGQNQKVRDERREQLLKAALGVFARKGLAAAKVSDIASAAGLSHGLVYHYFSSKDEIFTALVEKALGSSAMLAEYASRIPGTPLDQMRWITQAILSHGDEEASYYFLMVLQATTSDSVPPQVKELVAERSPAAVEQIAPLIAEGQKQGLFVDGDPRQLAVLHFSLLQGLIMTLAQGNIQVDMPSADSVLRLIAKHPG